VANRSKQKGSSFESLIASYLNEEWDPNIERLPLQGSLDRGDISNFRVGQHLVAIEAKNCARLDLAGWITEAEVEAKNYKALAGIVVHKRKAKGRAADQYVTLTLRSLLDILHAARNG
jgi:hypothetical protein